MRPYLFEIPFPWGLRFRMPSYGALIAVGFLICLYLLQRRGRRMGLAPLALFDMAVFALLGGLIGSRALYVAQNWDAFADNPLRIFAIWRGGLAFFGGLAGGAAGMFAVIRKERLPVRATLDVTVSLVPLGHAFGRLGCFMNGCCFGRVTAAWTGVRFPRILGAEGEIIGSLAFLEHLHLGLVSPADLRCLPVHPTQLYEAGYNLVFFALLSFLLFRRRRAGDVAWLYGMCYGAGRFVNEIFRADAIPVRGLGGLTLFQLASLALFALGLGLLLRSLRRPPEPLPAAWEPPPPAHGS